MKDSLPLQTIMKTNTFKTTAAYISGAITGKIWMPSCTAGIPFRKDLKGVFGCHQKGNTLRDTLDGVLMRDGGDFQNPAFTADTVLRVERRKITAPGKYEVHVFEREIHDLETCSDLVNLDAYTGDFIND